VSELDVSAVSVIGLGKLGGPMAVCYADKGFQVIGVDVDPDTVMRINQGKAHIYEPGFAEILRENRDRISATVDYELAVRESSITFIIVPTPSDESGGFSIELVQPVAERIGEALRDKDDFHLVVLTSTVMPGQTEQVRQVLENSSGKRCGVDFGLCYNPEFIALGSVIRDLLNPDFVLIGESDDWSGDILSSFYKSVVGENVPITRMNWINAELTKLSVNTFVTTKITFANMLAAICERLPGADVDVVTNAISKDTRIGAKYLKGATGYGGPCFPRDVVALSSFSRQIGEPAKLAEATDTINREQVSRMVERIKAKLPDKGKVGILGLSYKPDTDVIEESQSLMLARFLAEEGFATIAYDPAATEAARGTLPPEVSFASSMEACAREVDVLVIATPWNEFKNLYPSDLAREGKRPVLIDCWRILDRDKFEPVADYVALGVGTPVGGEE